MKNRFSVVQPQAVEPNTIGIVVSHEDISFTNSSGGTEMLPDGAYVVRLNNRGFYDYETGAVLHGNLLLEKDIEVARRVGTHNGSSFWKEQMEKGVKNAEKHYRSTLEAEAKFDPSYVRFHYMNGNYGSRRNFYPIIGARVAHNTLILPLDKIVTNPACSKEEWLHWLAEEYEYLPDRLPEAPQDYYDRMTDWWCKSEQERAKEPVRCKFVDGEFHLDDGHHRFVISLANNIKEIPVEVRYVRE